MSILDPGNVGLRGTLAESLQRGIASADYGEAESTLAASGNTGDRETAVDTSDPFVLLMAVVATSTSSAVALRISMATGPEGTGTDIIQGLTRGPGMTGTPRPTNIDDAKDGRMGIYQVFANNSTTDYYAIGLNEQLSPMHFPFGGTIQVFNLAASQIDVAWQYILYKFPTL